MNLFQNNGYERRIGQIKIKLETLEERFDVVLAIFENGTVPLHLETNIATNTMDLVIWNEQLDIVPDYMEIPEYDIKFVTVNLPEADITTPVFERRT